MSTSSITKSFALALLAPVLLLGACQMNVGTVEVHLVKANEGPDPLDPRDIMTLSMRIEGDGMGAQVAEFSRQRDGKVLTDIPLGKNRVLTVEGLDEGGFVSSRGVSTPFSIKSGKTKVYVYFSLVEKFSAPPFVSYDEEWAELYRTKMMFRRVFHTATLLPDDTVLVVGGAAAPAENDYLGRVATPYRIAERFASTPCAFLQEDNDCSSSKLCMNKIGGRARHTTDLLPGGTHVVVAGGEPVVPNETWLAEYYSIQSRSFASNIEMLNRTRHASAVLTGSREGIVVAGGEGLLASDLLDSIQLFEAGRFEDLNSIALSIPRTGPVAVAFPDRVVVIGGWTAADETSNAVDVIDFDGDTPKRRTFNMSYPRAGHTAVALDTGEVFVCGGILYDQGTPEIVESCELLNPDPEAETSTEYPGVRRWGHTATLLQDGRMLLAGGFSSVTPTTAVNSAVLFDTPVGRGSRLTLPMVSRRAGHTATLLSTGMVVLIGGVLQVDPIVMAEQDYEIFNPLPR